MAYMAAAVTAISPIAIGYPKVQCSSGIRSKFIPYTPATKDCAKKMAAQEEIFLTCSFCSALALFWRLAVSVPSSVSAFCSRQRVDGPLEMDDFTGQVVDPAGNQRAGRR